MTYGTYCRLHVHVSASPREVIEAVRNRVREEVRMKTVTRKIGRNRGKPRLWIEGKVLEEAGLPHGAPWELQPHGDGLVIVRRHPDGPRKVSGKPDRPVIDISGASLGHLGEAETVKLTYQPGSWFIQITKAS